MKRLMCFFLGHQWERMDVRGGWRGAVVLYIQCERCSKQDVVL
jgi:hypothetical protein